MAEVIAGVTIPDTELVREATSIVRQATDETLFNHSRRVFLWGSLKAAARELEVDPELAYVGGMFHDLGLTAAHGTKHQRFEIDGAAMARKLLLDFGRTEQEATNVWLAIALHTTPGVPQHMHPVVALVTAGVEMDVLGLTYSQYTDAEREAVVTEFPRTPKFKEDIIQAFYDGIKHKPDTTFGNVKADVIADKEPHFHRGNFCKVIRCSQWHG